MRFFQAIIEWVVFPNSERWVSSFPSSDRNHDEALLFEAGDRHDDEALSQLPDEVWRADALRRRGQENDSGDR